ncbi:MAG: glycosyltransferase family 2 protein [Sarcina sp.]
MTEKISIVVPVYNNESYVGETLKSILNQSYKNIEVIVINDGSKDGTSKIVSELAKVDSRIKFIEKKNEGVAKTRNLGIKESTGSYIMFVDGDDYILEDTCLELMNKVVLEQVEIVMYNYDKVTKESMVAENNEIEENVVFEKLQIENIIKNIIARDDINQDPIMGSVCRFLFKKTILDENNILFDVNLIDKEDMIFCIQVLKKAKNMIYIKKSFYKYRMNNSSVTKNYKVDFWGNNIKVIEYLENLTSDLECECSKRLYNRYLQIIISSVYNSAMNKKKTKSERVTEVKEILRNEKTSEIMESTEYKKLNIGWKIRVKLIKHKLARILVQYYGR